jgi:hypothetical protein
MFSEWFCNEDVLRSRDIGTKYSVDPVADIPITISKTRSGLKP